MCSNVLGGLSRGRKCSMSHLLILELPGGNDSDILSAALALGHRYTLGTADPGYYRAQPDLVPFLDTASSILTLPSNGALWDAALVAAHRVAGVSG